MINIRVRVVCGIDHFLSVALVSLQIKFAFVPILCVCVLNFVHITFDLSRHTYEYYLVCIFIFYYSSISCSVCFLWLVRSPANCFVCLVFAVLFVSFRSMFVVLQPFISSSAAYSSHRTLIYGHCSNKCFSFRVSD